MKRLLLPIVLVALSAGIVLAAASSITARSTYSTVARSQGERQPDPHAAAKPEPAEHGLSQKAIEIGRPFGYPILAARLREKISDEEVASVNASLARSLAQLQVKRRRRM